MRRLGLVLMVSVLLASAAGAATLHLTDGTTMTGDVTQVDERGVILKLPDGSFSDHVPWAKLSQDDLREFQQDPKAAQFVEPFIELTEADKKKQTEIQVQDFPHLQRPATRSLIGGMFTSGIGLFLLLVLYGANIYAAYEVSIFRARPMPVVCGVSAVAPIVGPVLFLCLKPGHGYVPPPTVAAEWKPPAEEYKDSPPAATGAPPSAVPAPVAGRPAFRPQAAPQPAEPEGYELASAAESQPPPQAAAPAAPAAAPAKVYHRGQFTFNRRFFETQMPKFFGVVRSGEDKDLVLSIKSSRGTYVGQRISRITATDLQLTVQKGNASEDVIFPFVEIQEVQIKHRDA